MSIGMSPVQVTAFEAASRKLHSVNKGYIRDEYIQCFASDRTVVNSPLMNRGYWLRTTIFENALVNFSKLIGNIGTPFQVVSIGAGFDTLYFRWVNNRSLSCPIRTIDLPEEDMNITTFLELDVKDMIDTKKRIIERQPQLKSCCDRKNSNGQSIYHLVACDLCNSADIEHALTSSGIRKNVPTFILAECVLVYLPVAESTACVKQLVDFFTENNTNNNKVLMASYDMMRPDDRFGQMMVHNLSQFGLNIVSIEKFKTVKDYEERYIKQCGFEQARGDSMKLLYTMVGRNTQVALNKIEMVDDWDEWGIVHDHYCFVQAESGLNKILPPFLKPLKPTFGTFMK